MAQCDMFSISRHQ